MANRIAEALQAKNGGNQSELARYVGVTPQAVQKWIAGDSEPKGKNLTKVAEFVGVSEVVLKYGTDVANLPRPANIARYLPQPEIKGGMRVAAIFDKGDEPDAVRVRKVKLRLSAGIAGFAIEQAEEDGLPIFFRKDWLDQRGLNPGNLIAIKVKGPSMEPGLHEDDTVVINTGDRSPKDGEVFAVNYEGEAVIKRMIRDYGFWWLSSDNPDQSRFPRKRCEGDACIIIGRVIHKQSERI